MRHKLFIGLLLTLAFAVSCHYGTGVGKKVYTPKEFINVVSVDHNEYTADSIQVLSQLRAYLQQHQFSFHNSEYSDSTELKIDTIIYSPEHKKASFFVIVKTPMQRRKPENRKPGYSFWYDAFVYLGVKDNQSYRLNWLRPSYQINWYDEAEIAAASRDAHFTEFAAFTNEDKTSRYKYNLNDKRFWESPVWDEFFEKR